MQQVNETAKVPAPRYMDAAFFFSIMLPIMTAVGSVCYTAGMYVGINHGTELGKAVGGLEAVAKYCLESK